MPPKSATASPTESIGAQSEDSPTPAEQLDANTRMWLDESKDAKDDESDSDDEDEAHDMEAPGQDGPQTEDDRDTEQHSKVDDEIEDDDEAGEEDTSLVGVNDVAASDRNSGSKGTSTTTGIASTIMKFSVFLKRELNKRKTGTGAKRIVAKVQVKKKETPELNGVKCVLFGSLSFHRLLIYTWQVEGRMQKLLCGT
jgi:hypothetical protein